MMNARERWLAAVEMKPVDRLPFWPKLNASYPRAQEGRFRDAPINDIYDWIGSDRLMGAPGFLKVAWGNGSLETTRQNGDQKTTYRTPNGSLELLQRFNADSQSFHPLSYPVKTVEDVKILADFFAGAAVEIDREQLERAREAVKRTGRDAATHTAAGTSALMDWIERLAGPENAHFLLADHPQEVAGLFEALHRHMRRKVELLCENAPCDLIFLTENTSTTLISPQQYRQLNYPHIKEYAQIGADAGRSMVLHMCGKLKRILPDLAAVPVRAFEAFTSPPVGDTTFLDGRSACPDKCLIGGTDATLWIKPADQIIAQIERDLDAMPHHRGLVVTSAGVMPPRAAPQTIKTVGEWVKAYQARM